MSRLVLASRRGRRSGRGQRGMSLIEVLVAVLIFSFGLLGLVALQARATQFSVSAEDTNRAALLANELAADMWAARSVTVDTTAWVQRVGTPTDGGLPNGLGTVTVTGTGANAVAEITITWLPPRAAADTAANRNRYTTQVMVQPP